LSFLHSGALAGPRGVTYREAHLGIPDLVISNQFSVVSGQFRRQQKPTSYLFFTYGKNCQLTVAARRLSVQNAMKNIHPTNPLFSHITEN
jgi:hypothetical protein